MQMASKIRGNKDNKYTKLKKTVMSRQDNKFDGIHFLLSIPNKRE